MAIRVSFLQGFNQGVNGMLKLQQQTFATQQQIDSGSKIVSASDDPVAAARIIQVDQEQSQLDQYIENTKSAEDKLTTAETQLEQVSNILVRVRELTIQANGLALTSSDRQGIATEIDSRLDELFDIANTQDVNGEFIFAGFQGAVQPFERTQAGEFIYKGDDGQRLLPISSSAQVAISNSGKAVFMDIDSVNNRIDVTADNANAGSAVVTENLVNDQVNYDTNSYPEDYIVQFDAANNEFDVFTQTDILNGGANTAIFSVANTGSPVIIDANSTPLAAPTNLGWQMTLTGTPVDGDRYYVNSSAKQNMLTTVALLSEGLKNYSDSPADELLLEQLFSDTLNNIDAAELNVSKIKAGIGAEQNTLESVRSLHEEVKIVNRDILSDLRDLDYAEAISRLSFETFALEASQQSFAKISNLSLFNFIR
jgi:flagellar hook-associated protein 3 FlgL